MTEIAILNERALRIIAESEQRITQETGQTVVLVAYQKS